MGRIFNAEQLASRADDLTSHNGMRRLFVTLDTADPPLFAWLEVEFYNGIALADIVTGVDTTAKESFDVFTIEGGSRMLGDADAASGGVAVADIESVPGENKLRLEVKPIGDYSTYTLRIKDSSYAIDPLFDHVEFKFRPGCVNTNCAPLSAYEAADDEPLIDYLAKDFHSFKHLLINAMRERVPGWEPTSEADLDQVIIDLIAADAEELSDYQDRVMNEAYLSRARKRVSLARHARLMDYHIHQGNQASTWLALKVTSDSSLASRFGVWTGESWDDDQAVIFASHYDDENTQTFATVLNELQLYTWGHSVTALEAGATEGDVIEPHGDDNESGGKIMSQAEAETLRDIFRGTDVTHLLIEQKLNPDTGTANGLDKTARQVVALLDGDVAAEALEDPIESRWFVRVHWDESDRLTRRFCFVTQCPNQPAEPRVTMFHANLLKVTHGRPHRTYFYAEDEPLDADDDSEFERVDYRHYEQVGNEQILRTVDEDSEESLPVLCRIPHKYVAYQNTPTGGEERAVTTIELGVYGSLWREQADLIESESGESHFVAETDELGWTIARFGNNINGSALLTGAEVTCAYQVGRGSDGNVGADSLTGFDNSNSGFPAVETVWNPLDVTDGLDPEPPEEIIRRAPQAYRARQLRAVTLSDYATRAEEIDSVSHAYASYAWTGSWRTVGVAIDLKAGYSWEEQSDSIKSYLDAVRLIGEDLEVREGQYVALDLYLKACAHADYWPEDLTHALEVEFSDTYTAEGRPGFFHPDEWTFGQSLYASQVIGRALTVAGIERVLLLSMRRWFSVAGASTTEVTIAPEDLVTNEVAAIEVEPYEIIQVASDPNHLEKGRIQFEVLGGRG